MDDLKLYGTTYGQMIRLTQSFAVLSWRKDELREIEKTTRKIMMMHGALHPRSDDDRVYVSPRHNRGRVLASVEVCAMTDENNVKMCENVN